VAQRAYEDHEANLTTPAPIITAPSALAIASPFGATFSIATRTASAAIQRIFMTPPTNSSAISAQQQPRQLSPWRRPIRHAPQSPSRQSLIRKPSGERHVRRQAVLRGVYWKTPAMKRSVPLRAGDVLTIIGETQPSDCRAHCVAVAAPLNAVHSAK